MILLNKKQASSNNETFITKKQEWENLIELEKRLPDEQKGRTWLMSSKIWNKRTVRNLTLVQMENIFKIIARKDPLYFSSPISAILGAFSTWSPHQKELVRFLIETKTIPCSSQLQSYIDNEFINNLFPKQGFLLEENLRDFFFSQYSDNKEANHKAEKIIQEYPVLTEDQAYLLITSIFGFKYVTKKNTKQLGKLIQTAPRYANLNLPNIPTYELKALKALV